MELDLPQGLLLNVLHPYINFILNTLLGHKLSFKTHGWIRDSFYTFIVTFVTKHLMLLEIIIICNITYDSLKVTSKYLQCIILFYVIVNLSLHLNAVE